MAGQQGDAVEPVGEESSGRSAWQGAIDHVGWLIPAVIAIGTMLRLAAVSRGDPSTALAILRYSDRTLVLISTASLVILLAIAVTGLVAQLYLDSRGRRLPLYALLLPLLVNLQLASTFVLSVTAVSTIIAYLHGYSSPRLREVVRRPVVPFFSTRVQVATAVSGLWIAMAGSILAISDVMWLPVEHVEIESRRAIVGYVLATEGDQTVVLVDGDRSVRYVTTARIEDRTLCRARPVTSLQVPLFSLIGLIDRPHYPRCPNG